MDTWQHLHHSHGAQGSCLAQLLPALEPPLRATLFPSFDSLKFCCIPAHASLSHPFPCRCSPKMPRDRDGAQRWSQEGGVGEGFAGTVNTGLRCVCLIMHFVTPCFVNLSPYLGLDRITQCSGMSIATADIVGLLTCLVFSVLRKPRALSLSSPTKCSRPLTTLETLP